MANGGHWLVLTVAFAIGATAAAGAVKADDCSPGARGTGNLLRHPFLTCPAPERGKPAEACYAAALVDGKVPGPGHKALRRCLPLADYADADVLVLGEVHNNWVHHALRAGMVAKFATAKQRRTAVVMEHIRSDQARALAQYQAALDRTKSGDWQAAAAGLGPALDWNQSGWPDWQDFQPLAEAAFKAQIPIYAGDVPRAEIRNVARKGLTALSNRQRAKLGLDKPLAPKLHDALLTELEAGHCGLMPKPAFATMADAQRLRDAALASAAVAAARKHGSAILLTGNGHARTDRGAPSYIRKLAPDLRVVSVAFVEAGIEVPNPPVELLPKSPDGAPAADAIVITGRVDRPDPCIKMRLRFKKHR